MGPVSPMASFILLSIMRMSEEHCVMKFPLFASIHGLSSLVPASRSEKSEKMVRVQ
jgi:hypothetical protein